MSSIINIILDLVYSSNNFMNVIGAYIKPIGIIKRYFNDEIHVEIKTRKEISFALKSNF